MEIGRGIGVDRGRGRGGRNGEVNEKMTIKISEKRDFRLLVDPDFFYFFIKSSVQKGGIAFDNHSDTL